MTFLDTVIVALIAAAFSLYLLVLFTAWLLVNVIPSKQDKQRKAPPIDHAPDHKLAA